MVALHIDPTETPDWFRHHGFEAETLTGYELAHQFQPRVEALAEGLSFPACPTICPNPMHSPP